MSARTTRLVVERELREAARRKGIWAMVILTFLGSLALVVVPEFVGGDSSPERVMVVGDDEFGIADALRSVTEPNLEVSSGDDRDAILAAIDDDTIDIGLVLGADNSVIVEDETSELVRLVAGVVADRVTSDRLIDAGIDPAEIRSAFDDATPSIEPVDVERSDRQGAAFIISMVLYILTVVLTSQVASGIAVQKANRVSEVLLAIIPPRSLLFGKVIGVGALGLVALLAGIAPIVGRAALGGDLPAGLWPTLAASSLWFAGGLALYLISAGAMGALVSRQEEVGSAIMPLTGLLIASYFVVISSPESVLSTVFAYVPFTSPMVVPFRIAIGAGSTAEYVVSAVLLLAAVVVVTRLGTTVFRRGIVRTGRRLKLREVLRPS